MNSCDKIYDHDFYVHRDTDTRYSAKRILGIVKEFYNIESICDLGCGVGTWLNVAREEFGHHVLIDGFDGAYVEKELLVIPKESFHEYDLNETLFGVGVKKRYDLAISLEVAEHLLPKRADGFVRDLCAISNMVLFSAATKLQGGDAHINEQRASYWINKFRDNGYRCYDIIRRNIWDDNSIQVWYRNNTFLFINEHTQIPNELEKYNLDKSYIDIIHPDLYESQMKEALTNKVLLNWYKLKEKGWNLSRALLDRGIEKVALYGIKGIGSVIYDDIVNSGTVNVEYFIDHYQKEHPVLRVYDYMDPLPEVDAIIITPIHSKAEIHSNIEGKMGCIIGIDDFIDQAIREFY